jgi:molybdopterin molybdotransferase
MLHSVADAIAAILHHTRPLPARPVALIEALGGDLYEPVILDLDAPPFDRAMLDGYAARAADVTPGAQLHIIARIDAGGSSAAQVVLSQGACAAINTGAPFPPSADVLIQVEHTAPVPGHPDFVQILKTAPRGTGIQARGHDARAGAAVLPAGVRLGPKELAVAAAAGQSRLLVGHPKPRIALLVTGDELVSVDTRPGPAQIRNTNHPLFRALLQERGLPILDLGTLRDEPEILRQTLQRGLAEADVLLVTGGMSMGSKDLVPQLLGDLGVQIHVEKVRMKPGKPFIFGTVDHGSERHYVAGLPGNPVSAFVCFMRLVLPLLAGLYPELPGPGRALQTAQTAVDLPENGDREFYQPCMVAGDPPRATPVMWRGSADLFTLARANGLLVHPAGAVARPCGTVVEVLPIGAGSAARGCQ